MILKSSLKMVSVLALVGFLAACESSEERAEKHYQSGLALLEQGEQERALVEFRNVFDLNGQHREARQTYARIVREQGKTREAYGQYLRLVEQYPDDVEGRIALAELSFSTQDWEEFDRHSARAIKEAPEDPRVQVIAAASEYSQGVRNEDDAARDAAFERAVALAKELPENPLLQTIEIDGYMREESLDDALAAIDRAIAQTPTDRALHNARLEILWRAEDRPGLEAQLREMIVRFGPDAPFRPDQSGTLLQALIGLYGESGETDKAEAFLREIADPAAEDPQLYLALVGFINQQRGTPAAIAELDAIISTVENPDLYRALRAGMVFDEGDRAAAIDEMQQIVADMEPSVEQRRIKVNLAQMLLLTGNEVGARQLVEQVLAEGPTQVGALRMHAAWQIEGDNPNGAIATLRTALDQAPQDLAAMTLMAQVYERTGNRPLAGEFLSLAVETSGRAPGETVRYARFLKNDDKLIEAEQVLVASLRQNRNNPLLLSELGRIYLALEDMARLRQVISQLNDIGTVETGRVATGLQTELIQRESGSEEAIAYLEEISKDWDDALVAKVALIRARLISGNADAALASAQALLDEDPANRSWRYVMAATQAAAGQFDQAREGYTTLLEEDPKVPRIWLQLIRIAVLQQRPEDAVRLTEEGLAANPGAADLLWVRAGNLEREGDIDGAIDIYEDLYAQNPNSVLLANNLASLITTYRDDAESLERAAVVAARLQGIERPAFQDTWGWIAFRRGKPGEALEPLESAAAGLPGDALVQYHLGRTYEALERPQDAIAQYEKAIEVAGPDDTRRQISDARERLAALQAQ